MTQAYGVFEGGGVKGIALVGALARAESLGVKFAGHAGTSAGAIVASLAAAGYPASDEAGRNGYVRGSGSAAPDLKTILNDLTLDQFLDGRIKLEDVAEIGNLFRPIYAEMFADLTKFFEGSTWKKWRMYKKLREKYRAQVAVLPKIKQIVDHLRIEKGIYRTATFTKWLDGHLKGRPEVVGPDGEVTFGSMKSAGRNLKVIATDLRARRPRLYDSTSFAGTRVVDAVRHSMSIPFFFCPCPENDNYFVDGGLLSNFPAWAFDSERKQARDAGQAEPTLLGFRLISDELSKPVDVTPQWSPFGQFGAYAVAVFNALMEGTDHLQTREIDGLITIPIPIRKDIAATSFGIDLPQRDQLFTAGWTEAGKRLSQSGVGVKLGIAGKAGAS
jgi:NTE family protein